MLGQIDLKKKPIKPRLFIAKPNREIIGRLNEAFNIKHNVKLTSLNDITFDLPYELDRHNKKIRNPNIDKLKDRFLVLVKLGKIEEWYMITNPSDNMNDDSDIKTISTFSLGFEIADKNIHYVKLESKNMKDALNTVLSETLWSIEYMDADFELTHRDFEFSSITALDAVFQIAETFNAVIRWNTNNRTISLIKPEYTGVNKGLKFSHRKYLKTLGRETKADEMVTRLKAFGKDGMSIESVNPTGQNYIEDFSYFTYPFERDAKKNVIQSSDYMSDSLCHALLDYQNLVESKKDQFSNLLKQKEQLNTLKSTKDAEMSKLKNQLTKVIDTRTLQQFDNNMWFYKHTYNGTSVVHNTKLRESYSYVIICKTSNPSVITIRVDGVQKNLTQGQWTVLSKVKSKSSNIIEVNGNGTSEIFIQIANTTDSEHTTPQNETALVDKYSQDNKEMQITAKQVELDSLINHIKTIDVQIKALMDIISIEKNFTTAQIQELNPYVITKEYSDENHFDPKELFKNAKEKFEEMRKPQLVINIDIVNFLEVVEEQRNWHKLVLGDEVTIEYEKMGIKVTAKIIGISYDYENMNINLTIANVKEISDTYKKFEDFIKKGTSTSTTIDLNKNKWTKTIYSTNEISEILERFWEKTTNEINMASNEFVTLDRTGLTIIDPNDPMRFLRATHGALALTRSGGIRYETAITADGIIAERLMGKILLTERVVIGDDDGILEISGAKAVITDRCSREVMKFGLIGEKPDQFGILLNRYGGVECDNKEIINRVYLERDNGLTLERKKGTGYDKTLYTSLDGDLFMKGNFQAGEGERIFKVTHDGFQLGGSVWETAPLHADMYGNVWMNKLFADTAEIKNSWFKDGHIRGSDLIIGDENSNKSFRVFPNIGIWAGHVNFDSAPFSVDLDGNLKAHKAIFFGKAGKVLIDTENGFIDFGNFDIGGIARLAADLITAKMIVADEGYINDLTVNKLKTLGVERNVGEYVDYIDIKDNIAAWKTSKVTKKEQAKDSKGRLLYFTDSKKQLVTTESSPYPFYSYTFDKNENWNKKEIFFEGNGRDSFPIVADGVGDGVKTDANGFRLKNSGRGYQKKPNGEYSIEYYRSQNGDERSIRMRDEGLFIKSLENKINLECKDFKLFSDNGSVLVELNNGSTFKLDSNGLNADIQGKIKLKATGGIEIESGAEFNLKAASNMKLSGAKIDLN
ncbi:phage tail protein [Paenibacillus sp. N1-5-1-14]|uniref:phage tail protein n=1 Tax=Paenibacillus radicibacter TaxID=2972488 RepID=UPI002159652F|nr:phage tail protein [Paenibacillus radicibacter]MCR8641555.1 phage tail protein [Paenibacillus radicibacter]